MRAATLELVRVSEIVDQGPHRVAGSFPALLDSFIVEDDKFGRAGLGVDARTVLPSIVIFPYFGSLKRWIGH
jgi:hypothetical protein